MPFPRARVLVVSIAMIAGCGFDPHGLDGDGGAGDPDAADATDPDATDAPIDATDARVIDAIDALVTDACVPDPLGERCNGADDDCDLLIDETFPTLGMMCDGNDGDACTEGVIECDPGSGNIRCTDATDTLVELCNGADDDCDSSTDEAFDLTSDPNNCGQCGRTCTNGFGTTSCSTSLCRPSCAAGANDCDGNPVNGCENRNTTPACAGATSLGTVRGDAGNDTLTMSGYTEAFFRVAVTESNTSGGGDIDAQVRLVSPANTDFDLFVTCESCGGALVSSQLTTATDTVNIGHGDFVGTDSYSILIEVRWFGSTACGNWALTVTGNVDTSDETCN